MAKRVMDPFFKNLEELQRGILKIVIKGKKRIVQNVPIQVAISVYSIAKYSLCVMNFLESLKRAG